MFREKNWVVVLTLVFSVGFLLGFSAAAKGAPISMTIAHDDKPGGTEDLAMVKFAELIEELTDGEIKPKVHPAAELGHEKELTEGVKMGVIHSTDITTGVISNWVPEVALLTLPYVFRSEKHARVAINGPAGDWIAKKAAEQGFVFVGHFFQGWRDIWATRPVRNLEEIKGLKLRTMQVPVHLRGYKALGINVIPLSASEIYMGLKTGLIEGSESPFVYNWEQKFYEVEKHVNHTHVFFCDTVLFVGRKWLESLTPKQQVAIRIAGQAAADHFIKVRDKNLAEYYEKAKAVGMQFHDVDIEPMAKICAPIRRDFAKQFAGKEGVDIVTLIEKLAKITED